MAIIYRSVSPGIGLMSYMMKQNPPTPLYMNIRWTIKLPIKFNPFMILIEHLLLVDYLGPVF